MKVSLTRIITEDTVNSTQIVMAGGKLVGMRICVIHK